MAEGEGIEALSLALRQVGDLSLSSSPVASGGAEPFLGRGRSGGSDEGADRWWRGLMGEAPIVLADTRPCCPTRLINEYGPTETVVGCCVYEVPAGEAMAGPVPIGRPIGNTSLYVLDDALQPVPMYVPGELYIGGVGVSRGDCNRPELTAQRSSFRTPFTFEPGRAWIARWGILARYGSDGNLEFLGRKDDQVKIRGFRVELGEIEAVLAQHPAVQKTAVMALDNGSDHKRLVAYLVPDPQYALTITDSSNFTIYRII